MLCSSCSSLFTLDIEAVLDAVPPTRERGDAMPVFGSASHASEAAAATPLVLSGGDLAT